MATKYLTPIALQECALAHAIEMIGDKWTLLILREILYGVGRFDQIQQDTGMSRTVLSQRLCSLVEYNILHKSPYRKLGKRTRLEYVLTPYGQKLVIPFAALTEWGEKDNLEKKQARLQLQDTRSGEALQVRFVTQAGRIIEKQDKVRMRIVRKNLTNAYAHKSNDEK